jgi:predicted amidohydrolase YtcJ
LTHTHLIFADPSIDDVPVGQAKNIDEFLELIRARAASTPKGQWIRTSAAWNESNLAERRMPVARDLDRATADHPVLVKRGGHNDVLNSFGMRLAGVTKDTPAPDGGTIVRDENRNPNGWLIDAAIGLAERVYPTPDFETQVDSVRRACSDYAACGITTVRDAFVEHDELQLFQRASERGAGIRLRPMLGVGFTTTSKDIAEKIDLWGMRSGFGDDRVRVWGTEISSRQRRRERRNRGAVRKSQ